MAFESENIKPSKHLICEESKSERRIVRRISTTYLVGVLVSTIVISVLVSTLVTITICSRYSGTWEVEDLKHRIVKVEDELSELAVKYSAIVNNNNLNIHSDIRFTEEKNYYIDDETPNDLYYADDEESDEQLAWEDSEDTPAFPIEVATVDRNVQLRRKRSPGSSDQGAAAGGKKDKRSKKSRRKKGNRRRRGGKCSNSLESIHFEARVDLSDALQETFDKNGEVFVPDANGVLTKEGLMPESVHYKFWDILKQGEGTTPSFIHISQDKDHYTIQQEGIYFIYAQILYHDLSGRWAFGIYVDDDLYTQCTTSEFIHDGYVESMRPEERSSHGVYMHCYTAAAVHVGRNQRVSIRSRYEGRAVVTLGKSTFWGIVKLSNVDSKPSRATNKHDRARTLL